MSRPQIPESVRKRLAVNSAFDSATSPQFGETRDHALHARVRKRLVSEEREFALDVAFHAAPGFTILFGPSGAGKTTLLDCVAGLTLPEAGSIAVGGGGFFDCE